MNDPAGVQTRPYDHEISLYDLWDVLMRRLPALLGVAVLTVLAGVAYALAQPVEYEYRTGVDLPRVYSGGLGNVVSQDMAITRLEDELISEQRSALFDGEERGPRVNVRERGSDYSLMLESTSTREGAENVADLHEAVAGALADRLRPRYERSLAGSIRPRENRVAELESQIDLLRADLDSLYERLDEEREVTGLIVAQQIGDIRRDLVELRTARVDAQSQVETIEAMSHDTELTYLISESENPVGPSRSLIVALSVVLGGMLGLFVAFFWEFVHNARHRRTNEA
ncbi:Uncharacterized protein involved in exopolysaccharide biosynthesis [Thioalkalivibrio sp. ALE21]|uniref:Wzz/FepE/Etk N-terminal domain-containing protein n=1 Tax=Thioalkalivibrio sp. ALE21 TaxID=1158175 RepID=UPI000D9629EF|nr:Wzz/FepE/Etk N-terminal domain-containing protein [Thioalkalivibrio sp. ALE21]PYF99720.1 Uncharacterized protein involved in exopolysaccharide biosynthesis [Thioalkalivibrio sp. ALE21]